MSGGSQWGASFTSASVGAMNVYDEIMVPRLFTPWAESLLDKMNLQSGENVLDIACGPGTVTRLAARRVGPAGRVTGCDLSPAMLELAGAKDSVDAGAPIVYMQCSADAMSTPDDSIDVVTCQQGLQFFPDRPAALFEMRRVLRRGGRLGLEVWCDIEDCPPFAALETAVRQVLGPDSADTYRSGPWGFGDSATLGRLVEEAGFTNVLVERHQLPVVFEGGPPQLLMTLHAAAVATALAQLNEAEQSALLAAVADATRPFTLDGIVTSYMTSNIVTAAVSSDRSGD